MFGVARGLAASGTAVIAFFMAAVLPTATWPLIDGDVWWHLQAGEEILASGAVPRVDSWSFTAAGQPWISQDWASNAVMAAVRGSGPLGETALSLLFGVVVVAAFAVLWQTIGVRSRAVGWAWRIVWLSLGLILAAPVLGVRVQVLDLLLSAIVLWLLANHLADRRRRWLAALPVLAALWANVHAGWPMLFLLGGAVLVGEAADRALHRAVAPAPLDWAELRDLAIALVAAFGALVLNPNGAALWVYPMNAIGNSVIGRYILEWYPVTDDLRLLALYVGFVVVAVIPVLLLIRTGLRAADALVVIGLTLMPLFAVRFLLFTGPLVAVVAAVNLMPALASGRFGRWAEPHLENLSVQREGRWTTVHLALAALLVVLGIGVSLAKVNPAAQAAAEEAAFPVGAVEWLDSHDAGERVFNRYEWGGYLIDARPGQLVYVDGRAQDVYSDELLTEYATIISGQEDPRPAFDRWRIDHVIFLPGSELAARLDTAGSGWARAYEDRLAIVWVRR